ncbi:MAG: cytochrome c3 family protein [Planctomycetota bacterium]
MTTKVETNKELEGPKYPEPQRFRTATVWLGGGSAAVVLSVVSWLEIFAIALIVALFYPGFHARARTPVRGAVGWDILRIDGNRAKEVVLFNHAKHEALLGKTREACVRCHHMSRPNDGPTECYVCHRDMYLRMSIFDHESHHHVLGGIKSCVECHPQDKAKERAKPCKECHAEMRSYEGDFVARSYEAAMHSLCIGCHKEKDRERNVQMMTKCEFCHREMQGKE